jgi:hypothetical protein
MQPRDEQALALWQAQRHSPEIESLLDAFFGYPTQDQYDRTLSRVSEAMSCPEIISPPSSLQSSGAL